MLSYEVFVSIYKNITRFYAKCQNDYATPKCLRGGGGGEEGRLLVSSAAGTKAGRQEKRADRGGTAMVIPVCRHLDTNHKKVRAWRTRPYLAGTTGSDFLMVSRKQDGHGITIAVPPRSVCSLGLTQWCGASPPSLNGAQHSFYEALLHDEENRCGWEGCRYDGYHDHSEVRCVSGVHGGYDQGQSHLVVGLKGNQRP